MKTTYFFRMLILVLALHAYGCGEDGTDGSAFLSIDWDWYVDSYWDNNSSIPNTFLRDHNYITSPGTYDYEYECSDGAGAFWGYEGTYTIAINSGTKAELFKDGLDGSDRFYTFYLQGTGSSFTYSKSIEAKKDTKLELIKSTETIPAQLKEYIGDVTTETFSYPDYTLTITKRLFLIKH
jgi:hypothetical protein